MREICTSGSTRGEEPQGYPVAPSPTLPARSGAVTEPRLPRSGFFWPTHGRVYD